jgi:hypothetical protein
MSVAPADVASAMVPSVATGTMAVPDASMFIGTLTTIWLELCPGLQMRTFEAAFEPMATTCTATAATPVSGTPPCPVTFT